MKICDRRADGQADTGKYRDAPHLKIAYKNRSIGLKGKQPPLYKVSISPVAGHQSSSDNAQALGVEWATFSRMGDLLSEQNLAVVWLRHTSAPTHFQPPLIHKNGRP